MQLTVKAVEKIIRAREDRIVTDDAPKGTGKLALRVRGNLAEWFFEYHFGGKRKLLKLGSADTLTLEKAREKLPDLREYLKDGLDPKAELKRLEDARTLEATRRSERGTVKELFAEYVADLRRRGKPSWPTVEKALLTGQYAAASILGSDRKAADIAPTDITAVLRAPYERGARSMAHHLRCYLGSAFTYGIRHENDYTRNQQGLVFAIQSNPVLAVAVDKGARAVGERVLTEEDIKRVWYEMPKSGATYHIHKAVQLILAVGGQRVREVVEARVEEFNLGKRLWIIPKSRTKNGREHTVPLTDLAAGLVKELLPLTDSAFLFPGGRDKSKPMTYPAVGHAVTRYCNVAGVDHWTPRDIRRTCRTMLADKGEPGYRLDIHLNHGTTVGVGEKHYEHAQRLADKSKTMSAWDRILCRILGLKAGTVIPFRKVGGGA